MTDWDSFYAARVADIVKLVEPPTRVEIIKEGWAALRPVWPQHQADGKCVLVHDLGIVPDILYEQIRYGDVWVIEAEGVIVERLPAR